MSYVTNVTILVHYMSWEVNDQLLSFTHERDGEATNAGFTCIDKHAGGGKVYEGQIWSMATNYLNERYRDDLFNILKGKATDCFLYEQTEDWPARIYKLDDLGWNQISKDPRD